MTEREKAVSQLQLLGSIYRIVMPYRYEKSGNEGENIFCSYMVLASRFYHPTADLNLQRAELTDGFRYYSSDIAVAAFQMPAFIVREYRGIIKR